MPGKLVDQQGGLGTGKMVCLRNSCLDRKDGVPKKLCG